MRPLINSTFVSLDGVVNHIDRWHFSYVDEESDQLAYDQLASCDAVWCAGSIDAADFIDDPRGVQQPLGEGGLTGVYVGQDAQVQSSHWQSSPRVSRKLN